MYLPWALQHGAGHLRLFELARVNPRRLNVTASGGPYLGCRSAAPESHPDSRPYTCRTSCGARRSGPSDLGCKAQASIAVADESAPTGRIELLPFLLRSSSAVELCRGIVYRSAASIVDARERGARHPRLSSRLRPCDASQGALCTCSWCDVYTIPASLSLGQRVTSDSAAGKRLSKLITRKGSASRAAG